MFPQNKLLQEIHTLMAGAIQYLIITAHCFREKNLGVMLD